MSACTAPVWSLAGAGAPPAARIPGGSRPAPACSPAGGAAPRDFTVVQDKPGSGVQEGRIDHLAEHYDGGSELHKVLQQACQSGSSGTVQRCEGLVHDQHLRPRNDGAADGEAAQLAAGKRARVLFQELREPEDARSVLHRGFHGLPPQGRVFQPERQFFRHSSPHRGEDGGGVLGNEAHVAAPFRGVDPRVPAAAKLQARAREFEEAAEGAAGSRRKPSGEQPAQGGLAAS
ncbi:hypothetical protein GCM10018951_34840 [Pseudarthrobacter polychromogenes]